jgi:hypothetical protein
VQHMVRIRALLKRIVIVTAASAHILVITDNKMDIKKLWEHYDDHLARLIGANRPRCDKTDPKKPRKSRL